MKNPFRSLLVLRRANKVYDKIQEGNVKGLWKSKTFWLNLIALFTQLIEVLPLDPSIKAVTPNAGAGFVTALGAANIAMRYMTTQPVTVVPSKVTE